MLGAFNRSAPFNRLPFNRIILDVEYDIIESSLSVSVALDTTIIPAVLAPVIAITPGIPETKVFIDFMNFDLDTITVRRSIQDQAYTCRAGINGTLDLDTSFRHVYVTATDHLDASHIVFYGVIEDTDGAEEAAADKLVISAIDYGTHLTVQHVQTAYQHNTATTNPADIITGLLDGTGIEAYRIDDVDTWGTTLNAKVFDFDLNLTKAQAITKICEYTRYMFFVKWRLNAENILVPCAYFVDETDIDTRLDIPAAVTITEPDSTLIGLPQILTKNSEKINKITVIGRNPAGGVYTKSLELPDLQADGAIAREYLERSGAFTTQAQVDARAQELYDFYITPATTYTALFSQRVDLEPYQKIKFVGYSIPETWMRITEIEYTLGSADDTVRITFTSDAKWCMVRRMYRSANPDPVGEIEAIFDAKVSQMAGNELVTVTAIDDDERTITCETEDGRTIITDQP